MERKNRLSEEQSPYLLQHADNPVHWFPWSEEAFEIAKKENKIIFLSIGYSTCHWCHVMEHESFEDEEVASLLNQYFISIKVDREERPDIDHLYMQVSQMLTGSGGWPLTVFMTPDQKPFFAGTYFPKESRYGRMGMVELLTKIHDLWQNKPEEVINSAGEITNQIRRSLEITSEGGTFNPESLLNKAKLSFAQQFDSVNGGFGRAPKFPSPQNLLFLLRQSILDKDPDVLMQVTLTLKKMRRGGIFDQLGYGFHRYSTDEKWLVPHFEKMLYDQAFLMRVYAETYAITKDKFYKNTVKEIYDYVISRLTSPDGSFYSAEDADSEGEEGKFYLWALEEIRDLLTKEEFEFAKVLFDLQDEGNFIDPVHRKRIGENILYLSRTLDEVCNDLQIDREKGLIMESGIREKLLSYRKSRIHPHLDDKILTDWNGMMISALIIAGRYTDSNELVEAGKRAYQDIKQKMLQPGGKLYHRYRNGHTGINGMIDDYAYMIDAALQLHQTTQKLEYLSDAIMWHNVVYDQFYDGEHGGFYMTEAQGETLIVRTKESYDGAIPSGNSMMLNNIYTLYKITGDVKYRETFDQTLHSISNSILKYPMGYSMSLAGVQHLTAEGAELVIVEENNDRMLLSDIISIYAPFNVIITVNRENRDDLSKFVPFIKDMGSVESKTTFYLCQNFKCNFPTNDLVWIVEKFTGQHSIGKADPE
ncbi:MAG: thioredoxin domain-containing protein [Calditrichia bacterium]